MTPPEKKEERVLPARTQPRMQAQQTTTTSTATTATALAPPCCLKQKFNTGLHEFFGIKIKRQAMNFFYVYYLFITLTIFHVTIKYNIIHYILLCILQYLMSIDVIHLISMSCNTIMLLAVMTEIKIVINILLCNCTFISIDDIANEPSPTVAEQYRHYTQQTQTNTDDMDILTKL